MHPILHVTSPCIFCTRAVLASVDMFMQRLELGEQKARGLQHDSNFGPRKHRYCLSVACHPCRNNASIEKALMYIVLLKRSELYDLKFKILEIGEK